MSEPIYYVIPSYLRSEKQETVDYLSRVGVPAEAIYVFVQTENDYLLYEKNHGGKCKVIYREANSVTKARNNILDYFGGYANLLMLDDDIRCFAYGSKTEMLEDIENADEFQRLINTAFRLTAMLRGQLFGFYPVYNNYFMHNTVSTKKPVNTVIGFPKGFSYRFDESYVAKEDIELCGKILNNGGNIVRFNNVTFDAKHRTNSGGCKEVWKSGVNEQIAKRLSVTYPKVYAVKSNNKQEVRTVIKDSVKGLKAWKN